MKKLQHQLIIAAATVGTVALGFGGYLAAEQTLHADSSAVSSVNQTIAPNKVATAGTTVKATDASGTKNNYQVTYKQPSTDNNQATLKKTDYNQQGTAYDKLNYVGHAKGQQVKLNGQTPAIVQGTMGKVYVHWNTDKWSVTTVANTQDVAKDPVKFAEKVDNQLQSKAITKQNVTHGSMVVYDQAQDGQANYVKWQKKDQVYQVQGQKSTTVMDVAASAQK